MMRLALHIFTKDARRLWWEITVTLGLLAYLAHMDSNRADYMPGPMEGLMNLVLPIAWAYLIALCVHQEPLVGDRQFWLTRPYPRAALILGKLIFALAFIHLPFFLADCFIVQARGFSPLRFISVLLQKQMVFALAITIPAIALAAATKNLAQLASAGLVALLAWFLLAATPSIPWFRTDAVLQQIVIGIIAASAAGIIVLQYSKRRTALARLVGITAFTAALAAAFYLPRKVTAGVQCRDSNAVSIAFEPDGEPMPEAIQYQPPRTTLITLPISVSGRTAEETVTFEPLELKVTTSDGKQPSMMSRPLRGALPREAPPLSAHIVLPPGKRNGWMLIQLDHSVYSRVSGGAVQIAGQFVATRFARGRMSALAIEERPNGVAGVGRCITAIVQQFYSREDLLKVMCESPRNIPLPTHADLVQQATRSRWRHRLGDARTFVPYPADQWLSPVNRRQTFFHIVEGQPQGQGTQWLVPRSALAGAQIEFTPEQNEGCSVVQFEAANIDLRRYTVKLPQGGTTLGRK